MKPRLLGSGLGRFSGLGNRFRAALCLEGPLLGFEDASRTLRRGLIALSLQIASAERCSIPPVRSFRPRSTRAISAAGMASDARGGVLFGQRRFAVCHCTGGLGSLGLRHRFGIASSGQRIGAVFEGLGSQLLGCGELASN